MSSASRIEIERIATQIRRAYEGPSWHGPAVKEVLVEITAGQAQARHGETHTIIEIVLHIGTWKSIVRSRVMGEPAQKITPEIDWLKPMADEDTAWVSALERLEKCQSELLEALMALDDDRLPEKLGGTPWTIYDLLHGVTQHDLYHAGQIALLKKLYS